MKKCCTNSSGQALVMLLFFMLIGITVTSAAVLILINNVTGTSTAQQSAVAYAAAESGVENALLRMLRDREYSGETLTIGGGTVVTTVLNGTITATGTASGATRKIQTQTVYNNDILTVSSWKEIY